MTREKETMTTKQDDDAQTEPRAGAPVGELPVGPRWICLEGMNKGELDAYDYGCAQVTQAVLALLDGKNLAGTANEPWQTVKNRIAALRSLTPQAAPTTGAAGRAPQAAAPAVVRWQHTWDFCPNCGGSLDTGNECVTCGFDLQDFRAAPQAAVVPPGYAGVGPRRGKVKR